jgi:hypothetical protein
VATAASGVQISLNNTLPSSKYFLVRQLQGAAGTVATGEVTPTVWSSSSGAYPAAEDAKCSRCHGADARPIFDSYPLWPGYYGSVQDTFPHDRIGQKQANNYAAFSAGAAKAGVYEDLIYSAGSPVAPFLDPRLFHDNTVTLDPKLFHYMPKARLGIAPTELNRQRIYRKLAAGEGFAANEKQLLAKLLECRPGDRPDRNAVGAIAEQLASENVARLKRLGVRPGDPPKSRDDMQELQFVREPAEIDWVAKRARVG